MTLSGDLQRFAQKVGMKADKVVRKVCVDFLRDLVRLTPVDTGLARSNWFFGTNRVSSVGTEPVKSGAPSINRALEFASTLQAGGVFYIVNNLPYIMVLEYGSSKQAPLGMARETVARWQKIVDAALAEVSR
jgi:hypothetical protein